MPSGLLAEDTFEQTSSSNFVEPLMDFFRSVVRAGRENSIVLREQAKAKVISASGEGQSQLPGIDAFSAACREAVLFAQQFQTGQVGFASPRLAELSRQAARNCATRKDEDVQAWAERLAQDVGDATD